MIIRVWYRIPLYFLLAVLSLKYNENINGFILIITSGFATTHVVVSVRHPITQESPHPLPTSLERMKLTAKVECGVSIHATVRQIQMFF